MLVAYSVALDPGQSPSPGVAQLRQYSADAAGQVERAASSVVLNLAEANAVVAAIHGGSTRWHTAAPARIQERSILPTHGVGARQHTGARAARSRAALLWGLTRRGGSKTRRISGRRPRKRDPRSDARSPAEERAVTVPPVASLANDGNRPAAASGISGENEPAGFDPRP